jgi:hypothetical protein
MTIEEHSKVLQSYAKFLNVPLDEVHHHLSVPILLKYAGSRKGKSEAGTKTNLSILHRYFAMELSTLEKMMDLTMSTERHFYRFSLVQGVGPTKPARYSCQMLMATL